MIALRIEKKRTKKIIDAQLPYEHYYHCSGTELHAVTPLVRGVSNILIAYDSIIDMHTYTCNTHCLICYANFHEQCVASW